MLLVLPRFVLKCLDCVQIPKGQQEKAIFT